MGRLKTFLEDMSRISRNAAEITDYSAKQEEMNKKIDALTESVKELTSHVGKLAGKVDDNTKEMTSQADRLKKIEVGLQLELFSSLSALHDKYMNRKPHPWATKEEKEDANRYYNQIHELGQDGWSDKYHKDIINLPETRSLK